VKETHIFLRHTMRIDIRECGRRGDARDEKRGHARRGCVGGLFFRRDASSLAARQRLSLLREATVYEAPSHTHFSRSRTLLIFVLFALIAPQLLSLSLFLSFSVFLSLSFLAACILRSCALLSSSLYQRLSASSFFLNE